jgi:hypothetical protein
VIRRPRLYLQVLILGLRSSTPRTRHLASSALRRCLADKYIPADLRTAAIEVLNAMARSEDDLPVRHAATSALPPALPGPTAGEPRKSTLTSATVGGPPHR